MIERGYLPASQKNFPYLRRAGLLLILMLTTACQPATASTQSTQVPTSDSPTPVATPQVVPSVQPMPPLWWDVITDDFEGGSFDPWGRVSESDLSLAPGMGHGILIRGCVDRLATDFIAAGSVAGLDAACAAQIAPPPFFVDFSGPTP